MKVIEMIIVFTYLVKSYREKERDIIHFNITLSLYPEIVFIIKMKRDT